MISELDKQLQALAASDWEKFKTLIGEDAVIKAKVCMLREKKRSFRYISYRLKISVGKSHNKSKKCSCSLNGDI